jgi:imidazolonepropionase-like amidohydrolase
MKNTLRLLLGVALVALAWPSSLPAQTASAYAITGAKVYTLAGPPLEDATVVIRDGKIAAVGKGIRVPAGAQVINAKGFEVYPGMFDPASEVGLYEVGAVRATVDTDEIGNYNPELVAGTAVNPASAHIPVTRANGITHVLAAPGGGVLAGQATAIHLAGWTIDEMQIRRSAAMVIEWPTLATRTFDFSTFTLRQRPFTEVKQEYDKKINELAEWIERAQHYAQAVEKGSSAKFERDLKLEALAPVVKGELPVMVFARRAREIRDAVEFCEKRKLKMILAGCAEAWKAKDLLKEKKIPVILRPTESLPLEEDDPYDKPFTQASELAAAGIKIAFGTFGAEFARRIPYQAGNAVAYGLPHDEVLKAVTLYPAQMFGLDSQFGTVETGKIANLIVTNGDLFEMRTEVRYLFIKGKLTSTDNKHRQLYEEYRKRP